ncbi:tyrosine-protein phosphatase [Ignatzschineria sp. LJL83]
MKKDFNFEQIINFRDLAGLKTQDNLTVKGNKIYRSALLDFATARDLDTLQSISPDIVVDFRVEGEKQGEFAEMVLTSLNYRAEPISVGNFFDDNQKLALETLKSENIDDLFIRMYKEFPKEGKNQFKTVFDVLQNNQKVIYHCSAGKDRTGVMSYLILSALGVHYDDIMENYLESNLYADALHQLFVENRQGCRADAKEAMKLMDTFQQIRFVDARYLDSLNTVLNEQYNGVIPYIEQELGVNIPYLKQTLLQ